MDRPLELSQHAEAGARPLFSDLSPRSPRGFDLDEVSILELVRALRLIDADQHVTNTQEVARLSGNQLQETYEGGNRLVNMGPS